MKFITLIIFIAFSSQVQFYAQQPYSSISGYIFDKSSMKELSNVNVFISGTDIGITTDNKGYYEIQTIPTGRQKIVVSMMGYETFTTFIDFRENDNVKYNFEITPRIYAIEPIEISASKPDEWLKNLERFKEIFFANSEFSKECKITNESAINLKWIDEDILKGNSDSLLIINNALGYKVFILLKNFTFNKKTKEYNYAIDTKFVEMDTTEKEIKANWFNNRKNAYEGSLKHFLKSLVDSTIGKEGFIISIESTDRPNHSFRGISDIHKIIQKGVLSNEKILCYKGYIKVRHQFEESFIKLKQQEVTLDEYGNTQEEYPFEVRGNFLDRGVAELLPKYYNPSERIKTDQIVKENQKTIKSESIIRRSLENTNANKSNIKNDSEVRESLKDSVLKNPTDINLRLLYATSLKGCCLTSAVNEYLEIIKIDSSCSEAWFNLGKIRAEEYSDLKRSIKKIQLDDEIGLALKLEDLVSQIIPREKMEIEIVPLSEFTILNFRELSKEKFDEAEVSLKKAVQYDSLKVENYLELCFLYEDAGVYKKGIEVLENLLKIYPDIKDGHLYLGLLKYKTRDVKAAHKEYNKALELMSEEERNDFIINSVKKLVEPIFEGKIDSLDNTELKEVLNKFWISEDPLYFTDYNERLIEHYSRVVYANLRFSYIQRNIPGWMTERGEILLRYGEPLYKVRYRPQISLKGSPDGFFSSEYLLPTEVWYYEGMVFSFTDTFMSGEFALTVPSNGDYKSQFEIDSKSFAATLRKKKFEEYKPLFASSFNLSVSTSQFKTLEDKSSKLTDVYVNFAVPAFDKKFENQSIKYRWGLFCFDSLYNKTIEIKDSLTISDPLRQISISGSESIYVNIKNLKLKPSTENMALEVIRSLDEAVSTNRGHLKIKDYNSDSLLISDLILSPSVIFGTKSETAINRNGIWVLPNPSGIFSNKEKVHIYFEVYNLKLDRKGYNNFEQEIKIVRKDDNTSFVGKIFGGVIELLKGGKSINNSIKTKQNRTQERNIQVCFQLDLSSLEKGNYNIELTMMDNNSNQEVATETTFTIKN
ncbi:MAG: carboxypeptidase-like regulatory domain-containing protein [Ignavibacteriales bacterium]|nr:carboxypeptidase-like regulatory domain-containing protein [Ignavibacteriales bacterium]